MKTLFLSASTVALALTASAGLAAAQTAAAPDTTQEVIVTGTRASGVKAADSAAPIEIIGTQALTHTGSISLADALLASAPSLNVDHNAGDAAAVLTIAALRGVSPNDTLVLVNGHRRHTTADLYVDGGSAYSGAATVDLSFIPVDAIDHVEVLTDGAAAQYGSDAIAGVVNIILKNSDHSGVFNATGGQYYEGDGNTGKWSINKGMPLLDKGFLNVTLEEQYHGFSTQGTGDRRVTNPDGSLVSGLDAVTTAGVKAAAADSSSFNKVNGDPQFNLYTGFWNAGYDLTPNLQLYAFGNYSQRESSHYENYRTPEKVSGVTSTGETVYPLSDGFDPREKFDETDYSFTEGLKGQVLGWNFDLSTTYGRDDVQVYTINSANAQLFPVLQSLSSTAITPQTNFHDGGYINDEMSYSLDLDRSFAMNWAASPLNVAMGLEQRRDTYQIQSGEAASYYGAGAQSFDGYLPTDAATHARTNWAIYGDFAIDPIQHLHTDLAIRYEDYSDFGGTTVGKFTARYDFSPKIAIRGTISNGFRAPTLAEEYYSGTNVSPTSADVQLPPNSTAAQAAGFGKLKPEQSDNYSLGLVLHPIPKLQITVDAYDILIKDRILVSGFLYGSEGSEVVSQGVLDAIKQRGVTLDSGLSYAGISIFANAANTETRGLEATANYASDFGDYGHVDWSAAANFNKTYVNKLFALPAAVANTSAGQTSFLTASALSALTTSTPRQKLILGAYWTKDKWSVNLRETIYGETSEMVSFDGSGSGSSAYKEVIPVTGITDLEVGYKVTPQIKLSIGANNLFDIKPPTTPNAYDGGTLKPVDGGLVWRVPYGFSPYGINGGYYYGRVTINF